MELTDVPGVGAAKAERLKAAGIRTVKQLAEIDLRQNRDIGIGPEVLKRAKQSARRLCDQEGIPYTKASYGPSKAAKPAAPKANSAAPTAAPVTGSDATNGSTNGASEKRPGLFARLFKRA